VGQRKGLTVDAAQIAAEIAPAQTQPKTNMRCQGTVAIIDTFTDGRKTTLNVEADVLPQKALKKTYVLLLLSPRARDSKIWKTLRGIRDKTIASSAMATSRIPVAADYFPPHAGDWERISPEEAGWNVKHLQAAMDLAGKAKSTGVVILLGGKILAEQYWDLSKEKGTLKFSLRNQGKSPEGHPIEDVASVQKSVTSFLVGVAQGKGLLYFEAPVSKYLGEGWSRASKAQEAKIAVYHLLSMSSGLNEALEYQAEAGTAWRYNTVAYSQTHKLLEKATGKDIQTITREWLTTPAGMKDSRWTPRGAGAGAASTNRVGFSTTARDLARFGLVMLRKGHWEKRDLLQNPGYLEQAVAPSQEMNKAYGLLWWLNGHPRPRQRQAPARLLPTAPKDLFAAQGALGRKLYVVPSLDLVITRIGDNAPQDFPDRFWEKLLLARGE
jgi:CubicO group peptidase (beta-lactamase class C family)